MECSCDADMLQRSAWCGVSGELQHVLFGLAGLAAASWVSGFSTGSIFGLAATWSARLKTVDWRVLICSCMAQSLSSEVFTWLISLVVMHLSQRNKNPLILLADFLNDWRNEALYKSLVVEQFTAWNFLRHKMHSIKLLVVTFMEQHSQIPEEFSLFDKLIFLLQQCRRQSYRASNR